MKKLLFIFILGLLTFGSVQKTAQEKPISSISKEIPEISKGILKAYLSEEELPNSLKLVSPPPEEGSAAYALDQEIAAMYVASKDEARKEQATKDAVLHFLEAINDSSKEPVINDLKLIKEKLKLELLSKIQNT